MNYSFNFKVYEEKALPFSLINRAFQYGDGLFETLIQKQGHIQFFQWHIERLLAGMNILGIEPDSQFKAASIEESIRQLCQKEQLHDARIKLQVWRKDGGLYTPKQNEANLLISLTPLVPAIQSVKEKADIAHSVQLSYSVFSRFKTCNALPYVLAGHERNQRALDELILLNTEGFVSECTSSNIFWKKGRQWFTPSLETGCIAGIMRRNLLENLPNVTEIKAPVSELIQADAVFCCNVTGIYPIKHIGSKSYATELCPTLT